MKLEWLLFAAGIGMLALIALAIGLGETPDGHGFADATFASLQVGGDGPGRISRVLWLGWAMGSLQIAFFVGCLALGLRRKTFSGGTAAPWRNTLLGCGVAFELVWSSLVISYWRYASSASTEIWLGLPIPTAIMLYGIWLVPISFCLFYVVRFDHWVLSEADLVRFRERVNPTNDDGGSR